MAAEPTDARAEPTDARSESADRTDARGVPTLVVLASVAPEDVDGAAERVGALVDRAFASGATVPAVGEPVAVVEPGPVETVVAHSPPAPGPETRVLERLGFSRAGTVMDPEHGPMWRWERARHGAEGFLGTWALDPGRCDYQAGEPPRDGVYVLAPRPDAVAFEVDWTDAEGNARHVAFETTFGEKDGLVMERPTADTLITRAPGGPVTVARRVLDAGRREMTVVQEGLRTDGAPFANTAVYVRIGWAPRAR